MNNHEGAKMALQRGIFKGIDCRQLRVCARCGEVYGPWRSEPEQEELPLVLVQKCGCNKGRSDETWPGRFDFNEVVTLCYCCGQILLLSGSRFSVWFCDSCRKRVVNFNTRFQMTVIPIGRHSVMAGYKLTGAEENVDQRVRLFVEGWNKLVNRMDLLDEWRRKRITGNMMTMGFKGNADLIEYLDAVKELDKRQAFLELIKYFRDSMRRRARRN